MLDMSRQTHHEELTRRALAAYYRGGDTEVPTSTEVKVSGGKEYVILRGGQAILACYRLRNDDKLKRLRRTPF